MTTEKKKHTPPVFTSKVFTIAPGRRFADALAAGIWDRVEEKPDALARTTVMVPTRRAARAVADAFLRISGGRPTLLPRLLPLGDVDEDALLMATMATDLPGGFEANIPPALSGLRRQMLLTRLILAREKAKEKKGGNAPRLTPDQAGRLASELAGLLDQVQTERLSFDGLKDLVPAEYAAHWQETLTFLTILTENWPAVLADEGAIDGADRRNRLLEARTEAWLKTPPDHLVVAAGSTGSIPATADLLSVVANLPHGMVVLPGLDKNIDPTWVDDLEPSHPQFGLYRLLGHLGTSAHTVADWPATKTETEIGQTDLARAGLVNQALAPAFATTHWRGAVPPDGRALDGVNLIECPGEDEEAGVIALIMREALQDPDKTAALITPDRRLARRVVAELKRWNVSVDDSAGVALSQTPPGAFLCLAARAAEEDFAPVSLLALLKHPLASGTMKPVAFRTAVRRLETMALRGARPGDGIDGIRRALKARLHCDQMRADALVDANKSQALRDGITDAKKNLLPLLDHLEAISADFTALLSKKAAPFSDLVRAHVAFGEHLAASDTEDGQTRLWAGEAGEALAGLASELTEAASVLEPIGPRSYGAFLDQVMAGVVVRPRASVHPRLHIWGLMEARLQSADVTIMGGLNEGTWPPEAPASPWMSRPMLKRFGLSLPERRIGLSAHDFTQAFSAAEVYLTRARRSEGAPTVPARWLVRLQKMLETWKDDADAPKLISGDQWLHWQRCLDQTATFQPTLRPAPKPPVSARPRRLSVTQVETWMRDPYAIYARHILGLRALDPLDADPSLADYGTLIHGALDTFLKDMGNDLPDDASEKLLAIGEAWFQRYLDRPGVHAFWWPRFERIAHWFIETERARREITRAVHTEITGTLIINPAAGPFTLTATADRIEVRTDGTIAIIDYKTGVVPSKKEVKAGFSPQLPLEAAIAEAGGFSGVAAGAIGGLEYWRLGGGEPAGEIKDAGDDAGALSGEALVGLTALVTLFDLSETAYPARPRPEAAPRYSEYEHLARIKEWATEEGDDT